MRTFCALFSFLLAFALKAQSGFDPKNYDSYFDLNNYLVRSADPEGKVDFTCAIFILPTDAQLELMEKDYKEDFQVIVEDQDFYMSLAENLLEEYHVRIIQMKSSIIRLAKAGGTISWTLDMNKKGAPSWNLIFFDINKQPMITSIVDLTEKEVEEYFNTGN